VAWEHVQKVFRDQHARGAMPGGVLVVRAGGRVAFAEAIGVARGFRSDEGTPSEPMTVDTPFQVMSVSKAVVAFIVAQLEDAGVLALDAPVARYFPEFAANGKGEITLDDVLTHRSGVLLEALIARPEIWPDQDAVVRAIADARPESPRGRLAYEAYAFGWILGEVVRRVTGSSIDQLVTQQFGADLPGLALRAPAEQAARVARNYWLGSRDYRLGRTAIAPRFEEVNNGIACFQALVPGAGMVCTAGALAAFYEMLLRGGVTGGGRRLVRAEVLAKYVGVQVSGFDRITGAWVRLGRGFSQGWSLPHPYGWWRSDHCFGHPGGFAHVAFADPVAGAAIVILTNANRGLADLVRRFAPLSHAARRAATAESSNRRT
jgi:CubicO group peptidase (beta-lactamase class C family)